MGLASALLVAATGCGYGFVRYDTAAEHVLSLAIETPSNESFDPGIEFTVANALRREALRRGGLRLTESVPRADLVLSGKVLPIATRGLSVSSVVLALEYSVTLTLDLTATLADGSEIAFDRGGLTATERYLSSADLEATRKNRLEALRLAASEIASRVCDAIDAGLAP